MQDIVIPIANYTMDDYENEYWHDFHADQDEDGGIMEGEELSVDREFA